MEIGRSCSFVFSQIVRVVVSARRAARDERGGAGRTGTRRHARWRPANIAALVGVYRVRITPSPSYLAAPFARDDEQSPRTAVANLFYRRARAASRAAIATSFAAACSNSAIDSTITPPNSAASRAVH